jgi:hypothetical protein
VEEQENRRKAKRERQEKMREYAETARRQLAKTTDSPFQCRDYPSGTHGLGRPPLADELCRCLEVKRPGRIGQHTPLCLSAVYS